MIDWSKLPDLGAVALLTCAFGSVARRRRTQVSEVWMTGWIMILLHFVSFMFAPAGSYWGTLASIIGLASLTWAGILFMWASVGHRNEASSRWMLASLLVTNTLYITLICTIPNSIWPLGLSAALLGALPLVITLIGAARVAHPLRWLVCALYVGLSIFLLLFQHRVNGADLALNGMLFTVYFGCSLHFGYACRRTSTGSLITVTGFLAWAAVFVVAPLSQSLFPGFHVEAEVWNLPKYIVAVGMILLILEEQIEHNEYLALHDDLTGLANRRLFQDRLASALERARRSRSEAALLLIDLDHFKQINDTVGHHIGDLLLRRVGEVFLQRVRRSDTVARTGGDEFSIILEEPINRQDAERVSESLIRMLEEPLQLETHFISIGASIGIAMYPTDGSSEQSLCIAADRAMYAAKFASRDREAPIPSSFPLKLPQSKN